LTISLYQRPFKGGILAFQQKFLDTADEQEVLDFEHIKIKTYRWLGKGPRVLLLHGWESNTWRWRKMIYHLKENGFDIVGMDAPAHGGTKGSWRFNAELYAKLANVVCKRYPPEIVIGHSVGGMTTVFLASHFELPSIQKYVVLASSNRWLEVAGKFHKALGLNTRIIDNFEKAFRKYFDMPQAYYNADDFAEKITRPGLIIHDKTDEINFLSEGQAIAQRWKNSTMLVTNGYGHSLQSDEVYQAILNYIK
jgi:pimeloyl-ACP methyl ester carboxylesterase